MKKRLLSVLLMCCMVLALLPTVAFAEDGHTHCVCGDTACTDTAHGGDLPWTGIFSLDEITKAGNYYLKNNVTLSTFWECKIDGVNLCLNGHDIIQTRSKEGNVIYVNSGNLAITDCHSGTAVGKVTHAENATGSGVTNNGTFTLWNGSITGNNAESGSGGGVYNISGCTFNMYGGSITGNSAKHQGGGVFNISGGTFNMYGGSITRNSAKNGSGGGVFNNNYAKFNMYGGSITDNTTATNGGGVYIGIGGTFTVSGSVDISGNKSGTAASNVYLEAGRTITIENDKPLDATARISITAANPASYPTVVTGTTDTMGFFSDNADYMLADDGSNGLKLADVPVTISGVELLNNADGNAMTDNTKVYDGKAVAYDASDVSYTPTVSGVTPSYTWQKLNGETYSDLTDAPKAAGSYRLLVSAVKNDYTLGTQELAFTISPKELTIENLKVADKTYDGTDKATIIGTPTLKGVVDEDDVSLVNGTPTFMSTAVGKDIPISFTPFSLTGEDIGNYTLTQPSGVTASITAKSSGGGGGSSTYTITMKDSKNGTVTADRRTATYGTTVTLTVQPDQGWTLETLTAVTASGKEIDLNIVKVGETYTFKMPSGNVTVTATFMEDNTILNYFVDVPTNSYYYEAVLWAVEQGVTQGTDDSHFSPDGVCTRAQAVTFLWRAAGSPAPKFTAMPFTDVPVGSYYYDAVLWAVENGITKGTSATEFSPDESCSRAQIVTFLYRSEQVRGNGMEGAWMFQNPFADMDTESYYGEAVMWAIANNVTEGITATTFSPNANCTRAQIVTFLWRTLAK